MVQLRYLKGKMAIIAITVIFITGTAKAQTAQIVQQAVQQSKKEVRQNERVVRQNERTLRHVAKSVQQLEQEVQQFEQEVKQIDQAVRQAEHIDDDRGDYVKYEYDEQKRVIKKSTYVDENSKEPYMTQTYTYSENDLVRVVTNIDSWRNESLSNSAHKSNQKRGQQSRESLNVTTTNKAILAKPEFQGNITEYLSYNLKYPEEAIKARVNIRVTYSFAVEEDGTVKDIKWVTTHVEKDSKNPDVIASQKACEKAAYEIIASTSNKWDPVRKDNLPVRTEMSLPIWFKFH